jgi:putative thioredoxin
MNVTAQDGGVGTPVDVDESNFDERVVRGSFERPVLVDFWAAWCGPCRALAPVLERMAIAFAGRFTLAKLDTDRAPNVAARYGIRGIPACKLFVDGEVVDEFTGAVPEASVRAFLERALPSPAAGAVAEALAQVAAGDAQGAWDVLERAAALDPASEPLGLARIEVLTALGRLDEARALADAIGPRVRDERRLAALAARIDIARSAGADLETLAQRAGTGDPQARLDYANALAARGEHQAALGLLLDLVRSDRAFGDDAARKAMLRMFDALGADSELVRRYRRELASALNK